MKKRCYLIAVMVISVLFLFPTVAADNDSMKILLTFDRYGTYSGGETAKVTVHVFDRGGYVSPDNKPNCTLGDNHFIEIERDIDLIKKATGRYDGFFQVHDSDTDEFKSLFLEAKATYGKSDMEDIEYNTDEVSEMIYLEGGEDDNVEVKIKNVPPSAFPGDSITVHVEVRKGNILTDADDLDIKYELDYDNMDDVESDLPYDKVETGVYEIVLDVPDTIAESCEIKLDAVAGFDDYIYYGLDSERIDMDFFSVWYRKDTVGQTITNFDIYVSDSQGKALGKAEVSLEWEKDRRSSNEAKKLTDGSGKATFEISYDKDTTDLELKGKVEANGKIQVFSGDIMIRESEEENELDAPSLRGLDVIIKNRNISGSPPYKVDCIAYLNGQRISNKEIYCYLYSKTEVFAFGSPRTDVNGEFNMTFFNSMENSGYITAEFEVASGDYYSNFLSDRNNTLDGKEYSSDRDIIWIEVDASLNVDFNKPTIKIDADPVTLGRFTEVTVKGIPDRGCPLITWIPAPVNSFSDIEKWEEDFNWSQWGGGGLMIQNLEFSGSEISCNLMIPEFLPPGEYTILGGYYDDIDISDPDLSLEEAYHLNNLILMSGESGSTSNDFTEPVSGGFGLKLLVIGIIVVILVIALTIVIILKRRKKNQENAQALWENRNQTSISNIPHPPEDETHRSDVGDSSAGIPTIQHHESMDRNTQTDQRSPTPPYGADYSTAIHRQRDEAFQHGSHGFEMDDEVDESRASVGHFHRGHSDFPPPRSTYPPPPTGRSGYPPPPY